MSNELSAAQIKRDRQEKSLETLSHEVNLFEAELLRLSLDLQVPAIKKEDRINLRISVREKAEILAIAQRYGISVGQYI